MQPFIYIGIFLSEESRKLLLERFPARHKNAFADHATLVFRPSPEKAASYELGQRVDFNIVGYAADEKGQAVVVDLDESEGGIAHITVSTADGVKPVYSNDLLKKGFESVEKVPVWGKIGGWNGMKAVFGADKPQSVSRILVPTRPQTDTIIAVFVLKTFGKALFPGIENAAFEVASTLPAGETPDSVLAKGTLALDIGGGELDHHGKEPAVTVSELVSMKLGVKDEPALAKLLELARRDDIVGKGTVSSDALDRAFGLSGLVTAMNKTRPNDAGGIVRDVLPLITAHYMEELKRTKELPEEFAKLKAEGKIETFEVRQRDKKLGVILLESDNTSMPGYLRSGIGGRYDVVVQRMASGHTNILTRPVKRIDLRSLALVIRMEEANQSGMNLDKDARYLSQVGRIAEIGNWYFDDATNSIQNGGANPKDTAPTKIDSFVMRKLVEVGLSEAVWSPMRR